jgi:hypothetical protein
MHTVQTVHRISQMLHGDHFTQLCNKITSNFISFHILAFSRAYARASQFTAYSLGI